MLLRCVNRVFAFDAPATKVEYVIIVVVMTVGVLSSLLAVRDSLATVLG